MSVISDGIYFLHPEGAAWIGAEYGGGRYQGRIDESNADTHAAAGDHYAGIVPRDDDIPVTGDAAAIIVREVLGEDIDPAMVTVTRERLRDYDRDYDVREEMDLEWWADGE